MSTDVIKARLVETYPNTTESEWKRASKRSHVAGVERQFVNKTHDLTVVTIEHANGDITVIDAEGKAHSQAVAAPVAPAPKPVSVKPARAPTSAPLSLQVGDTVVVPKGVTVISGQKYKAFEYVNQHDRAPSKRASTVEIGDITDASENWHLFISEPNQSRLEKELGVNYWMTIFDRHGSALDFLNPRSIPASRYQDHPLVAQIKAETDAEWGDYILASWSNGERHCRADQVVPTKARTKAAPKEQAISKRRQMVVGSEWEFTSAVEITLWVSNPKIGELLEKRESYYVNANSTHRQGNSIVVVLGGGRPQTQAELDAMAAIQKEIEATDDVIHIRVATIPAGTRIKVTGKVVGDAYYLPYDAKVDGKKITNGLAVPVSVTSGLLDWHSDRDPLKTYYGKLCLPYTQIEKAVEALSVPEEIVHVMRDTATGEFFAGWDDRLRPKMSKTFSGAKKYKTASAVKASIMDFTGYTSGMAYENEEGYKPEWVGNNDKKMDLPPTWESVAIDKTTNTEKGTSDLQQWYTNLMRLRALTVLYGSSVRTVFKKIENKPQYSTIVAFKMPKYEKIENVDGMQIDRAVEAVVPKPIMVPNERARAFAVESVDDAVLIKLGYSGRAVCSIIDTRTLEEIVQ